MLKVHVIYEHSENLHPHCSSHIRLLRPLSHPLNSNISLTWSRDYQAADVVIVERLWQPGITLDIAEDLVQKVRADRCCLIYVIDDNLLDLKPSGLQGSPLSAEQLRVVRYFAKKADGILVSTEALKERLAGLNSQIIVIPNALDERLIPDDISTSVADKNNRLIIGYMGTFTHDADVMMVMQPLREILQKYQERVELQFIGAVIDPAVVQAFWGLPLRLIMVNGENGQYPNFLPWMAKTVAWDLAIAPLEDNAFTRCKSDIKFLDYSALGIPGIYSRVLPYENTVSHLETGYLAENNPQSWIEGLECLIGNADLRCKLAKQAREYLFSHRVLQQCAQNWGQAILSIYSSC